MTQFKTSLIDQLFYLVREPDGTTQWYAADPMKASSREKAKVDIGKVLIDHFGIPDAANPIAVKIRGGLMQRCRPFDIGVPERIRGGLDAHLEDFEGASVEIVPRRSDNVRFPLLGLLIDADGLAAGYRRYSRRGECEDGVADHRLVVMDGAIPHPAPDPEEDTDE